MTKGYCSNEALKVLSPKEKQLKELLLQVIMATQADKKEVIRTLAFLMQVFKSKRVR